MHPKRTGIQYTYNVSDLVLGRAKKQHTNGECTMHIAFMDRGTELDFVEAIHERYGSGPIEHTSLGDHDPDWDIIYPVSSFLDTYRFPLPRIPFEWPILRYKVQENESDGDRRIQLSLDFVSSIPRAVELKIDRYGLADTGVRCGDFGLVI